MLSIMLALFYLRSLPKLSIRHMGSTEQGHALSHRYVRQGLVHQPAMPMGTLACLVKTPTTPDKTDGTVCDELG